MQLFTVRPRLSGKKLKNFYRQTSRILSPRFGHLRLDWASRPPISLTQEQLNRLMDIIGRY